MAMGDGRDWGFASPLYVVTGRPEVLSERLVFFTAPGDGDATSALLDSFPKRGILRSSG